MSRGGLHQRGFISLQILLAMLHGLGVVFAYSQAIRETEAGISRFVIRWNFDMNWAARSEAGWLGKSTGVHLVVAMIHSGGTSGDA